MQQQKDRSNWPHAFANAPQTVYIPPGTRFGKLTVIKRGENIGKNRSLLVECDCGEFKTIQARYLRTEKITSCGCEKIATVNGGVKSNHPLYMIWKNMHGKCNNRRHASYPTCGGVGIRVCERWFDFSLFIADMGPRPPKTLLTRVNPMQNYTPENTRWLTAMKKRAAQNEYAAA